MNTPATDLGRIRDLRSAWFDDTRFAQTFNKYLDNVGFTAQYVDGAITAGARGQRPHKTKVIKDNTWGMLEVDWQTLRLLDSPLVQRLRSVRQLGFSYLTYPSAEHSRFVHSLGMHGVVARFLDAMGREWSPTTHEGIEHTKIELPLKIDLLHAAVLHDAGHLPFSHALENALESDPSLFYAGPFSVEDFRFSANEHLEKALHLSECLSLAIILSPRFQKFYDGYVRTGSEDTEATLRIAALVAGLRPSDAHLGAGALISNSAVDSDKVDYINRDSVACGIPVGIDVARLFLRSSFFKLSPDVVERLTGRRPAESQIHFIVNASGVDTIDELAHARAALYQRVYLHQTTRNAERMLCKAFESLPLGSGERLRDALELLAQHDASLLQELSQHATPAVKVLGDRLRTRYLPKRACVFGRTLVEPLMPISEIIPGIAKTSVAKHTTGVVVSGLRQQDGLLGPALRELEDAIKTQAKYLATLVKIDEDDRSAMGDGPSIVSVLPMTELKGLTREAVVLESNELIYSSNRSISDEQNEAADLYKALGYVLSDQAWRNLVCIAARKVFATRYIERPRPMALPRSTAQGQGGDLIQLHCAGRLLLDLRRVVRRAGLDFHRVHDLQSQAEKAKYFDDAPWVVPIDESATQKVAERFRAFQGQHGWHVTASSCASFVSQFPSSLRTEVLELLSKFVILDRDTIVPKLKNVVLGIQSEKAVWVAALSPDSGSLVRMLFEQDAKADFEMRNIHFAKSVEEALTKMGDDDELVLCDDNISSGSQAQCQFRAWLGIPREQWPESQRSERGIVDVMLGDSQLAKLRIVRTWLAICVGSSKASATLQDVLKGDLKLNFAEVRIGDDQTVFASLSDALKAFLHEVGFELAASALFGVQSKKDIDDLSAEKVAACRANSLGYDNRAGIMATYFNVPTATLTAFWCPGMARGHPWMPLLIRRGHLHRLIVA